MDTCVVAVYDCSPQYTVCLNSESDWFGIAPCVVDSESELGDGICNIDGDYNTNVCSWDGGDCCESTCNDGGTCLGSIFACKDTSAIDYEPPTECEVSDESFIGDAYCDKIGGYNTAVCNWDGGDCCEDTCESIVRAENITCGGAGYCHYNHSGVVVVYVLEVVYIAVIFVVRL